MRLVAPQGYNRLDDAGPEGCIDEQAAKLRESS